MDLSRPYQDEAAMGLQDLGTVRPEPGIDDFDVR